MIFKNPLQEDNKGVPYLTEKWLKRYCSDMNRQGQGFYITPELNDKLYLHFMGLHKITSLEAYTGLKSLWMEGNAINEISGLSENMELRCLFLQENMISKIENLEQLQHLDTLALSHNQISMIENLAPISSLHTLQLAHNKLSSKESIAHLAQCPCISVLDLSNNSLSMEALEILEEMPNLAVLNLMHNPIVRSLPHYRKTLICRLPKLKYLDDRPVFEDDRRCAEAWSKGGLDAERAERAQIIDEKRAKDQRNHDAMRRLVDEGRKKRLVNRQRRIDAGEEVSSDSDNSVVETKEAWADADAQNSVRVYVEEGFDNDVPGLVLFSEDSDSEDLPE